MAEMIYTGERVWGWGVLEPHVAEVNGGSWVLQSCVSVLVPGWRVPTALLLCVRPGAGLEGPHRSSAACMEAGGEEASNSFTALKRKTSLPSPCLLFGN